MLALTFKAAQAEAESRLHRHFCFGPLFLLLAPALLSAVEPQPVTLQAWDDYVREAKMHMAMRARGRAPFLWLDEKPETARRVRSDGIIVEPVGGYSPHAVRGGLIHDWLGAMFLPKAQLARVKQVLDDYDRYPDVYKPMVVKARVLEQTPDHERITLLMAQKTFWVTGAVETENDITLTDVSPFQMYSLSASVQVHEIADFGKPSQHAFPQDNGPGYVWRTFTLTRLEQCDDGVYEELEMIALSRGIPLAYRWLVQPLAEHLPRNVLLATLQDTRDAVSQEIKAAASKAHPVAR
jgi:hypothetical protein